MFQERVVDLMRELRIMTHAEIHKVDTLDQNVNGRLVSFVKSLDRLPLDERRLIKLVLFRDIDRLLIALEVAVRLVRAKEQSHMPSDDISSLELQIIRLAEHSCQMRLGQ
jgi:hypothetical protein